MRNKKVIVLLLILVVMLIFIPGVSAEERIEYYKETLSYVTCGDAYDIPSDAPRIISLVIKFFKYAAPIALIISSMITLAKAMAAGKEDEMNKAKSSLIRRMIAAVLAFFVVSIVQLVLSIAADGEQQANNIEACLDCFVNNDCETTKYYKVPDGTDSTCYKYSDDSEYTCPNGK